jgi:hypothetical protein
MLQKDINIEGFIFTVEYEVTEADKYTDYQGGEIELNGIYYEYKDFYPVFDHLGKLDYILKLLKNAL